MAKAPPIEHPTLEQVLKLVQHLRETEGADANWRIRCNEFGPHGPPYTVESDAVWGERPEPPKGKPLSKWGPSRLINLNLFNSKK